jgi:hypothetical protein
MQKGQATKITKAHYLSTVDILSQSIKYLNGPHTVYIR